MPNKVDNEAGMEVCFRHNIRTRLETVCGKTRKECTIGVLNGKNQLTGSLSLVLEMPQVEETADGSIQPVLGKRSACGDSIWQ